MATQLFFIPSSQRLPGIHRGTNTANLAGTTIGWTPNLLSATRGTAALSTNVTSVLGPTNGVEGTNEWLSMPLASAVTISGTITLNLWSSESNASANGAVNAIIERVSSTGAIVSTIAQTGRTTELGTSVAAANFTVTPTSTNMAKGDRFRVRVYFDDAAAVTMASGFTFAFSRGAATVTTGDSYVTFTETFTLQTTVPAGTTLYPTTTTGPAVGANDEFEMWTSPGGAATTAVTNRVLGWTAPVQWTGTGGGTAIEWYSKPLTAFTLAGLVECNLRAFASNASGIRAELAVCNGDGSSPVVWAASDLIDQATPEAIQGAGTFGDGQMKTVETAIMGWLAGADVNVTNGQRLRLRVLLDDTATAPLSATGTGSFVYNGPTAAATGDSWIQLPQSVTEFVVQNITTTGIASTVTFGTPTVTGPAGTQNINTTGVASTVAFGTLSVAAGAVNVATTGITSTLTFGTSTVTAGPVTATVTGIATTLVFGTSTVAAGAVARTTTGIATTLTFGTLSVAAGAVNITTTAVASTLTFGTPTIVVPAGTQNIAPAGIGATVTFGVVTVGLAGVGRMKVWTGSAWADKPTKVWTGSAWVEKPIKVWNGNAWVLA